jgi:thiamine biosynthesis protein ThiI
MNSIEINQEVGRFIIENSAYKVDVHKPDTFIYIELDENFAYIYTEKTQ